MPSVADLVVHHLREAGVCFVFGMPGGGGNLDLIDAAGRAGLPFVLTATETGGAIAALAQAEISGRPGACLTTLGPGVASVINGVACAWLDRAPLLVFTDGQATSAAALFEHQRLDHRALLAPVTKWSATISAENADEVMREAIDRAMTEPRGPVHIDCPADALSAPVTGGAAWPADHRSAESLALQDPADSVALLDPASFAPLLSRARKPLLLVGLGARRPLDAQAIAGLCARRGVPAMVTYKAKGVVPDADTHFAGVFTHGALERTIIDEADLLIGVGLDPVELIPRPWTHRQTIVNIGPWGVEAGHVPFAAQLVTDIPSGMQLAGELLQASSWDLDAVHRAVVAQRQRLCPHANRLAAHRVVQIAADAAATRARGAPGSIHDADRPVLALTGDGGLLMCAGELLTAVRERLHVIVIVFSDASLSLIDIKQRQRQHPSAGVVLGAIDWGTLAASVGGAGLRVETERELEQALARALAYRGLSVIEARIDPGTYAETLRAVRG